jgi:uncharacterized protein YceK
MKSLPLLLAALLLAGCATVPLATDAEKQAATAFVPPPGTANIYIIRREAYAGAAILAKTAIDTQMAGGVQTGSFVLKSVPPGHHTVSVFSNENQDSVSVNVQAGQNYYFDVKSEWGVISARFSIHEMPVANAQKAVLRCKRVRPL